MARKPRPGVGRGEVVGPSVAKEHPSRVSPVAEMFEGPGKDGAVKRYATRASDGEAAGEDTGRLHPGGGGGPQRVFSMPPG